MTEIKQKSTKLTNTARDSILDKIDTKAFKEKKDSLEERRYNLSMKVYNDIYPKDILEKMQALPDGWLPKTDNFNVQFGSSSSNFCHRMLKEKIIFLHKHCEGYRQCLKVYDDNHPLSIEHDILTKEIDALKDERNSCLQEAKAMLYSCSTTRQLKEAWPEIAELVEQYEPVSERSTSIMPIISGLNTRLGFSNVQ